MKNILLTVLATILVPGLAVAAVPYWILQVTRPESAPQEGVMGGILTALALLGAGMVVWVSITFVTKGKGTPIPIQPPRAFIAEGLYRFVRNPMYLGVLLILSVLVPNMITQSREAMNRRKLARSESREPSA